MNSDVLKQTTSCKSIKIMKGGSDAKSLKVYINTSATNKKKMSLTFLRTH